MAIVVEHEKRKCEILEKALDVFVEQGYEDATFQKIADRCGITRTTLYIYFKNKREIFLWSIKQLVNGLEETLKRTLADKSLDAEHCLRQILMQIIDTVAANSKLFSVLLNYVLQLKKSGANLEERIQRRIVRLRHILSTVIIRGMEGGEFKRLPVKDVNDLFYGLIEAAVFRLSLLGHDTMLDARTSLQLAVDGIMKGE